MPLSFIHFSDTHLGFNDYDKQNPDGTNIREQDFYDSFTKIIDRIIDEKPSFAVHTGDLFHRASPTNKTIVFALEQIRRISGAGIPLYIIAGNHDYPKSAFTTPIHNIFKGIPGIQIFFNEQYEFIETSDYIIHALPHINDENRFSEECAKITIENESKPNFLFMHLSVGGSYIMDEFGERIFPASLLRVLKDFDYVGLGHWHKYQHLHPFGNVYYSGSTERPSEKEAGDQKGYLSVCFNGELQVRFNPLSIRSFLKFGVSNCFTKSKEEIIKELQKLCIEHSAALKDSIISVQLSDLDAAQLYIITLQEICGLFPDALHINITRSAKDGEVLFSSGSSFDLKDQLNNELRKSFIDDREYMKVRQLTMSMLSKLDEEEASADQ